MSAPERIPSRRVTPPGEVRELLAHGTLTLRGRIRAASNAVFFGVVEQDGHSLPCVYKPVAGERPLWDFPDGNLARREAAAFEVSEATGWGLIPVTVLREGPYGEGMCQEWIGPPPGTEREPGTEHDAGTGSEPGDEAEPLLALIEEEEPGPGWKAVGFADVGEGRTALLVHADDDRLRRLAVLDAVINNGDRKGGHLLTAAGKRLFAIDHGVTFHAESRLRTLLWGWAGEPLPAEAVEALRRLSAGLAPEAPLATRLAELITAPELDAVRERTDALLASGLHPLPGGDWPAIPWPPV